MIDAAKLSNELKTKYRVSNDTFLRDVKIDPERKIATEIGDSKEAEFKPQVKTSWFDNEYNRSIRATVPEGTVRTEKDKIIYETPDVDVVQYDKPEAGEEGGHELEWVLKKKPKTNELPFTLRYKGDVHFKYQPKTAGIIQSDKVIGSYAVYIDKAHHSIGGNNYATGKIEHIYRPKAIDAKGKETWCDIFIPENGQAETNIEGKVTVPQKFLDEAVYPVVVDPTFGYTSVGASFFGSQGLSDGVGVGNILGSKFTGAAGTATSISAYIVDQMTKDGNHPTWAEMSDSVPDWKYAIYKDGVDGELVGVTGQHTGSGGETSGWFTLNLSSPAITAQDYWLYIFNQQGVYEQFVWVAGDLSWDSRDANNDLGDVMSSPPATLDDDDFFNPALWKISIYCTYTEEGGGTSVNDTRGSRIKGKDTSNASRGGRIIGKDTSNSARSSKITGRITSNDSRGTRIKGTDTANSSRGAKMTGNDSTDSERVAKIIGKDTSNSTRGARIIGIGNEEYSRENASSLTADDTILTNVYTGQEIEDVADDDSVRVGQSGPLQYLIHQFKIKNTNDTDIINASWNGQSTLAPSSNPVILQIYNRTSDEWETIASNNAANADTDFDLSGQVASDLSDYYDGDNFVSLRVYQSIT